MPKEKIEIETPEEELTPKEEAMTPPKEDKTKAVWQFKYTNYRAILPMIDPEAQPSMTGRRPNVVIKARNYRLELDLTDKTQKATHEALLKDGRCGLDFWLLTNAKRKQKTGEQGEMLRKLMRMNDMQLRSILTADEMREAGLEPGKADRFDIAMAIITSAKKQLVDKIEE